MHACSLSDLVVSGAKILYLIRGIHTLIAHNISCNQVNTEKITEIVADNTIPLLSIIKKNIPGLW